MTNWTCKDDVLRAVSLDGHALENASEALRGDKDVVLAAVKQKGWALEYASPALRNDPEVVLAAVAVSIEAFDFASDALKNCKQTLLKAIEQWPSAFGCHCLIRRCRTRLRLRGAVLRGIGDDDAG